MSYDVRFNVDNLLKRRVGGMRKGRKDEHGIKETKELLKAMTAIGIFVGERARDGLDVRDLFAIPGFFVSRRKVLTQGFEGADKVPAEVADLTPQERQELAEYFLEELLPKLLKHIKG